MKVLSLALAAVAATALATSASATIFRFDTNLLGSNETPPTPSTGSGFALITWDDSVDSMRVQVDFSGLTGMSTASHIHAGPLSASGTRGVATQTPSFALFPLGVTSGTYDHTFDMNVAGSYNPAFITAQGSLTNAKSVLFTSLGDGTAYLNVHSSAFPGGEIRGTLRAVVPEPATWSMMILGLGGAGALLRRRRAAPVAA